MRDDNLSIKRLVERVRFRAKLQSARLNTAIRARLDHFAFHRAARAREFDALMNRLQHVRSGRHFTRDEMNER